MMIESATAVMNMSKREKRNKKKRKMAEIHVSSLLGSFISIILFVFIVCKIYGFIGFNVQPLIRINLQC